MTLLNVSGISKRGANDFVLHEISFEQQSLQKIAIAGESGSGKTTLLKIIAGLLQPDTGNVLFEQQRVKGPAEELIPGHPGIAYLSQHFELRNNYRVEEILEYASKLPEADVQILYDVCGIGHLLKRKTDQLSGGERQRIALARLLSTSPRLLLLDEPFSNLDMIHKNTLKSVIHDIGDKLNITCMMISHDPLDTLSWADEIMVMKDGKLIQKGTPTQIYRQPADAYTAALFGKYNLLSPALAGILSPLHHMNGEKMLVRPEHLILSTEPNNHTIQGEVKNIRFLGSYYETELFIPGNSNLFINTTICNISKGAMVYIGLAHGL